VKEQSAPEKTEDIEIRLLLEALYVRYHYDFRSYAMASIKRRLKQAREQLGLGYAGKLVARLGHVAAARRVLDRPGQ
jgi:chemotaxis protein methyltransferase CheR